MFPLRVTSVTNRLLGTMKIGIDNRALDVGRMPHPADFAQVGSGLRRLRRSTTMATGAVALAGKNRASGGGLPALAAARLALARRNLTIAAASASEKLFGGIVVFGIPRRTIPTSSGSVVARRKRP